MRPAYYALGGGGWRDYVTLLHPPYTLWHLSYVAIGAGLAPVLHADRLLAGLASFFLALGIGAHALDELKGRPLQTAIGTHMLVALAVFSIAGAIAIGIGAALAWAPYLLVIVAAGGFLVVAYNLELFGGRFHGDAWFALAWGSLPVLAGFVVMTNSLAAEALAAAVFAALLSLAQRRLSTRVRMVRRRVREVSGNLVLADGRSEPIERETLLAAPEGALRALVWAAAALATALVLSHAV